MRKLLYSFVFASILVLVGSAALASPDEPGTGGTVSDGDYQVWLPVVERGITDDPRYSLCPFVIRPDPANPPSGAIVRHGESITFGLTAERIEPSEHYAVHGLLEARIQLYSECDLGEKPLYWSGIEIYSAIGGYFSVSQVVPTSILVGHYCWLYQPVCSVAKGDAGGVPTNLISITVTESGR